MSYCENAGMDCALMDDDGHRARDEGFTDGRDQESARWQAKVEQLKDALRRMLPMAEAWHRREFDGLCGHEEDDCTCDREASTREDIQSALAILEEEGV